MVTHNRLRWPATKAFCLNLRAYCQLRSLRPYITDLFGLTSTAAHLCGALVINIHQKDQRLPATPLLWPVPTTPAWHHFIIYMWKLRHSLCPNDLQISFSESDLRLGPLAVIPRLHTGSRAKFQTLYDNSFADLSENTTEVTEVINLSLSLRHILGDDCINYFWNKETGERPQHTTACTFKCRNESSDLRHFQSYKPFF